MAFLLVPMILFAGITDDDDSFSDVRISISKLSSRLGTKGSPGTFWTSSCQLNTKPPCLGGGANIRCWTACPVRDHSWETTGKPSVPRTKQLSSKSQLFGGILLLLLFKIGKACAKRMTHKGLSHVCEVRTGQERKGWRQMVWSLSPTAKSHPLHSLADLAGSTGHGTQLLWSGSWNILSLKNL